MAQTKIKLIADGVIDVNNLAAGHTITTDNIGEGSNLYYTDARVSSYLTTNSYATESFVTSGYLPLSGGNITGNFTVDTNTLYVDATNNRVSINGVGGDTFNIFSAGYPLVSFIDGSTTRGRLGYVFDWGHFGLQSEADLVFRTGSSSGTEKVRITSAGNVGIGTSSPNQALTIQKSGYPIINFYDGATARGDIGFNTGTTSFNISSYSTIPMAIYTNGSERLRIDSSGNVGIGQVPDRELNLTKLTDNAIIAIKSGSNRLAGIVLGDGDDDDRGHILYNNTTDHLQFATANIERMRISSAGNVGIGTSSPASKAHIKGALRIEDSTDTTTRDFILNTESSGALTFSDSVSGERMRIEYNGHVGIGQTPTARLDVNSGGTNTVAAFRSTDSGAYIGIADPSTTLDAGYPTLSVGAIGNNLILTTANAERMRITSGGGIESTQNNTAQPILKLKQTGTAGYTALRFSGNNDTDIADFTTFNGDIYLGFWNGGNGSNGELRINKATGNVILPNGNLVFSNGKGIDFSATGGAAGRTSNLLDDYEEGTWTPNLAFGGASVGITYTGTGGTYTKIGRQVTVNGLIILTSKGTSTGDATITNLPFAIANSGSNYSSVSIRFNRVSFANQHQAYGIVNSTSIALNEITEAGTNTVLTDANFANDSDIIISFTYFV